MNFLEAMIGDTNLFFNESDQPNTAEVEIMIANVTYRRKKRGWEAVILMLLYGICFMLSLFSIIYASFFILIQIKILFSN